jgi:hypothetical protein
VSTKSKVNRERKAGRTRTTQGDSHTSALPMLERWDHTEEGKERYHRDGQRVLRAVAEAAGLSKGEFEVISNKAGPAVSGEVSLYADRFHLWISSWGSEGHVTARTVKHRKDYTGDGPNVSVDWELLWDPESLVQVLKLEGVIGTE